MDLTAKKLIDLYTFTLTCDAMPGSKNAFLINTKKNLSNVILSNGTRFVFFEKESSEGNIYESLAHEGQVKLQQTLTGKVAYKCPYFNVMNDLQTIIYFQSDDMKKMKIIKLDNNEKFAFQPYDRTQIYVYDENSNLKKLNLESEKRMDMSIKIPSNIKYPFIEGFVDDKGFVWSFEDGKKLQKVTNKFVFKKDSLQFNIFGSAYANYENDTLTLFCANIPPLDYTKKYFYLSETDLNINNDSFINWMGRGFFSISINNVHYFFNVSHSEETLTEFDRQLKLL